MRKIRDLAAFPGLALAATLATAAATGAEAACVIQSSPCYPWRIEASAQDTVLLEIVPNNAPTFALYRVCLCPPAKEVSLVFDFADRQVALGTVATSSGTTVCRDYRIATARKSRLLLRRTGDASAAVEGCYTTQ